MNLTDYTRCGECSNCGQCCSDILHLSEEEIKRIDKYLKEIIPIKIFKRGE